jgi:hypothetical protein
MTLRTRCIARASALLVAAAALTACGGGGGDGGGGGSGPLSITTAMVDDGVIDRDYSETIASTGGRGTKSFSISSGALPAGLSMSASGAISGVPTGPAGSASFTVQVTDSADTPATDTQALTIDIVEPLEITTAVLADTGINVDYAATVAATGGTAPYTFSVSSGELPAGVALATNGSLTGTVSPGATTEAFQIAVQDSSSPPLSAEQPYTVRVAMEIATAVLADADGGFPYNDSLLVLGGLPPYDWSLTGGTLPPGLTGPDAATGVINGTPIAACTATNASLSVQVVDSDIPAVIAGRSGIGLAVNTTTPQFTAGQLPNGRINISYDQQIQVTGGVPPYSFAVTSGSLPSQLSLNAATGRITGTPDTLETQGFEVTVTDDCPVSFQGNLTLTIAPESLGRNDSIATATPLPGNGTYSASISPSGDPNGILDPDEDFYRITTTATSTITIDINAQVLNSPLDPVIELLDGGGNVLNQCVSPTFVSECVNDDEELGVALDSLLQVRINGAGTFYIHVLDWGSNARPDFVYDLVISGVN